MVRRLNTFCIPEVNGTVDVVVERLDGPEKPCHPFDKVRLQEKVIADIRKQRIAFQTHKIGIRSIGRILLRHLFQRSVHIDPE